MTKKYCIAFSAKCLVVIILLIALIETQASGEEVSGIELEKIIVTNRRAACSVNESSENVEVIGEDEIQQLPSRDLGEALKYIPGVYVDPRQGFGRSTAITIQGCDSRQVRVMIDGIPFNSQSSGQINPAIFPIENIERIEVIKGASSSIWGSSLGGVVNIITKDTGTTLIPKGSFTSSFAEFRTRKEDNEISGKAGDLGYYLFSSYMESGGFRQKDDVREKKAFGKLSYDLKDMGKILASFGYSYVDANSGEFPEDGGWEAQPIRSRYGKVSWRQDTDNIDMGVELKHSRQEVITESYYTVSDDAPYSRVENKDLLYQLSLNSNIRLRGKDLLVLGADFDWDALKSNTYINEVKSLALQAPYINYTLKLNPWDFNCGLRYDHNSEFGEQISPSLGAVYHWKGIPDTLIRLTVSRAFNAPPLLWKYNEDVVWGGCS